MNIIRIVEENADAKRAKDQRVRKEREYSVDFVRLKVEKDAQHDYNASETLAKQVD